MCNDKNDIDSQKTDLKQIISINHNLTTAFKKILNVPRHIDIAQNMLQHEDCTELQKGINIEFLENIEKALNLHTWIAFDFNEADYAKYSSSNKHSKDWEIMDENEEDYLTNRYIESIFSRIFKDFIENPDNYLPFKANPLHYRKHDIERLNSHLETIVELYLYKAISLLAYECKAYDVALMYHDYLMVTYSGGSINESYDSGEYFKKEQSKNNTKAVNKRWEKPNQIKQQRKKEYLKIMREHNFPSAPKAAEYIFLNKSENEDIAYSTILNYLREAVREEKENNRS